MEKETSYSNIFKTTFLFGFIQVFKAIISVVKNKLVAILIGAEGMGLIGIYQSTIRMIQTGASLGLNQSAVRDIAECYGSNNESRLFKIINIVNKLVLITGSIGCLVTLIFSKYLSQWTFEDTKHQVMYIVLSFSIGLNIINEGKQAILKGVRHLRSLAFASLLGTTVGLVTAVPMYYYFGYAGIVPEFLIASTLALLVSQYYVNKINIPNEKISLKELMINGSPMIKMGVALMLVTFFQTIVSFILNSFIRSYGGLDDVGYYNAGNFILTGYFGMITTALATDYYPRIASVNKDNIKLKNELNKQSLVSVILCCPMIILFVALMPFFIKVLYTSAFFPVTEYIKYAIFWTVITICSNQADMILIAKYNTKVFISISIVTRVCQLILSLFLYKTLGLKGLGIAYAILGILHFIIMFYIVKKLYNITLERKVLFVFLSMLIMTILCVIISELNDEFIRYCLISFLIIISIVYSYNVMTKDIGLNFFDFIKNKLKSK